MIYYVKDMKTKEIIEKAQSFDEALDKLKALGEGIIEIL